MRPKTTELFRYAIRTWKRFGVLYIIGVAVFTVCAVMSLKTFFSVADEKAEPDQVVAHASDITDAGIIELEKIEGVENASAVLEIHAAVKLGDKEADIPIKGIERGFVLGEYSEGNAFSEDTTMPHIVLNEAALHLFEDRLPSKEAVRPDIAEETTIVFNDALVIAKISGVLMDEGEEPAAYVSIEQAKSILLRGGILPEYAYALIRVENVGAEERVIREAAKAGYTAETANAEKFAVWEQEEVKAAYLFAAGLAILLCAVIVRRNTRRLYLALHKAENDQLLCMGLKAGHIRKIGHLRAVFCDTVGGLLDWLEC